MVGFMKKNSKTKIGKLIYLYMCLIFQKTTIIILIISFILMLLGLILFSNPSQVQSDYILAANDIHKAFFQQGVLLTQIFNIIIIVSVVIVINITSNAFDLFFISSTSRYKICLAKFICMILFSLLITMVEMLLIYLIAFLRFNRLMFIKEMFISNIFIIITLVFDSLLSLCTSTLISSIFVPMMFLFISIIIKVIINNYNNVNDLISLFYPVIELNNKNVIEMENFYIIGVWIVLLLFLYISIYNVKEIKNI